MSREANYPRTSSAPAHPVVDQSTEDGSLTGRLSTRPTVRPGVGWTASGPQTPRWGWFGLVLGGSGWPRTTPVGAPARPRGSVPQLWWPTRTAVAHRDFSGGWSSRARKSRWARLSANKHAVEVSGRWVAGATRVRLPGDGGHPGSKPGACRQQEGHRFSCRGARCSPCSS